MRLDVLPARPGRDPARSVARYRRALAEFCAAGLEAETLDLGTAICTPDLYRVPDANCMVDVRVPAGMDAGTLWEEATRYFMSRDTSCLVCAFASGATEAETQPLTALLQSRGWVEHRIDVLRLERSSVAITEPATVLSARAAMKQYEIFTRRAAELEPQLSELATRQLDDPRWEVLAALIDGRIVAQAGVFSQGETGLIESVHVQRGHRGGGLGRAVMQHAIDLCARSQFLDVVLGCKADNAPAQALYASLGFAKVGESASWFAPRSSA